MVTNNIQLTNKIIKYLVYALIVYTLFAYVPQKKLPISDILIMTTIIICSFILLDLLTPSDEVESFDVIEKLDDVSSSGPEYESDQEDESDSYINYTKPLVLKELQDKEILDADEIEEIIKVCNNKDQCSYKLKELLNNDKINNQQFLELHVVFGLDKFKVLQDLYLQERLNREQVYLIAVAISSKSFAFIDGILKKYVSDNILTKDDSNRILTNIGDSTLNMQEKYLAVMIEKGEISTLNAKIINDKCFSASLDSCSIQLNKFKKDNVITNKQAFAILKSYNKPGINDLKKESVFGSISNQSEIGSLYKTPDLGEPESKPTLLQDDELLKQAKSIAFTRKAEIDKLIKENNELQLIVDEQDELKTNKINNRKAEIDRLIEENNELQLIVDKQDELKTNKFNDIKNKDIQRDEEYKKQNKKNYEEIQKLLKKKTSEEYNRNHDMSYSIYTEDELKPLGSFSKDFTNSFTHGYSNLATNKWRPPEYENSICKIEEECDTCNGEFENYPVELSNWNNTRKILPRDNININYLQDKLNDGKY
jgi:hypothetical protein